MKKPGLKSREIRRRVGQTLARLLDHKRAPAEPKPEPESGSLSHETPVSKRAVYYQPHRCRGTTFRDTRGDVNVVAESGAVRNVTKPKSRVKRQREARKKSAAMARTTKNESTRKSPPGSD